MVLITKPKNGKLDPLKIGKSFHSSSGDSQGTNDSQLNEGSRERKSFIYPPDLRTAQQMIRQGQNAATINSARSSAIQVTDYNRQCTCEDHSGEDHSHSMHLENAQDADNYHVRSQIDQITSPRGSDLNFSIQPEMVNSMEAVAGAGITVKNENLFNMMKESAEREQKQ